MVRHVIVDIYYNCFQCTSQGSGYIDVPSDSNVQWHGTVELSNDYGEQLCIRCIIFSLGYAGRPYYPLDVSYFPWDTQVD